MAPAARTSTYTGNWTEPDTIAAELTGAATSEHDTATEPTGTAECLVAVAHVPAR